MNTWFQRWAKKQAVAEDTLCRAAREIINGQVEADLGGGLFKKGIARPGQGKSGGYRVVVGYKAPNSSRILFVFGFGKNQQDTVLEKEEKALKQVLKSFFLTTDKQIADLLKNGTFLEVLCHE